MQKVIWGNFLHNVIKLLFDLTFRGFCVTCLHFICSHILRSHCIMRLCRVARTRFEGIPILGVHDYRKRAIVSPFDCAKFQFASFRIVKFCGEGDRWSVSLTRGPFAKPRGLFCFFIGRVFLGCILLECVLRHGLFESGLIASKRNVRPCELIKVKRSNKKKEDLSIARA